MANFLKPVTTPKEDVTTGVIRDILGAGPSAPDALLDPTRPTSTPPIGKDLDLDDEDDDDMDRDPSNLRGAARAVKAARANGPRDFAKLFAGKAVRYRQTGRCVKLIKAAWQEPQPLAKLFAPAGTNVKISDTDLQSICATHARTMRKTAINQIINRPPFPKESDNSTWENADPERAGASSDFSVFHDEGTERPNTEHIGGFTDSQIAANDPRRTAPVDAVNSYARVAVIDNDPEGRAASIGVIKRCLSRPRRW